MQAFHLLQKEMATGVTKTKVNATVERKTEEMDKKMSLKLLIDKNTSKLLYAEGEKDFVDFLFSFMTLPLQYIAKLLKQEMSGSFGKLDESMGKLGDQYFLTDTAKYKLLRQDYIKTSKFLNIVNQTKEEQGFVKDAVAYLITDDLEVTPMSTISGLDHLIKFKVKEVTSLEVNVVEVGIQECLKLMKASLESSTVLTDVFLEKECSSSGLRSSKRGKRI